MSEKKKVRSNFRKVCLERDLYRCKCCGTKPEVETLDVHHITDRNEMPNGGYVKENGISLCNECHKKAEVYHSSGKLNFIEKYHPNDLYKLIFSSFEKAKESSLKIK